METKENRMDESNKEGCRRILLFHVTGAGTDMDAHTNVLISKMNAYAKEQHIDVMIHMESASQIGKKGKEADIILLTPELFAMLDDIKAQYPGKVVKVIDQKEYGYLHGKEVLMAALA